MKSKTALFCAKKNHKTFASLRSAVAALEFALIVPSMVLLTIGVLDMSRAVILWQEVYNAAHTIPLSASVVAVQTNKTTSLSVTQAQQQMSAIYAEMPWLADGIADGTRSVTLSSITYVPIPKCTPVIGTSCYIPNVAWSLAYPGGVGDPHADRWQTVTRSCVIPPVQTHPTASPPSSPLLVPVQLTVLRTLDVTQPDPILVADVHVQYRPFLFGLVTGSLDFWASGYWSVRSISPAQPAYLQYTTLTPSGTAGSCPSWP